MMIRCFKGLFRGGSTTRRKVDKYEKENVKIKDVFY